MGMDEVLAQFDDGRLLADTDDGKRPASATPQGRFHRWRRRLVRMAQDVVEVEQALLALSRRDRAAVIHRGLQSLDDASLFDTDQGEVDAAWRTELRRRVSEIEDGTVELLDVDESHAQLRAELAARRR